MPAPMPAPQRDPKPVNPGETPPTYPEPQPAPRLPAPEPPTPAPETLPSWRRLPARLPQAPPAELGPLLPVNLTPQEQTKLRDLCTVGPGGGASMEDLEKLLREVPQILDAKLRYLVSGGFAVDLASETRRSHKDIDIVFTSDETRLSYWYGCHIDAVNPKEYFAHMELSSDLLTTSYRTAWTRLDQSGIQAHIVHPGLVLIQKTSSFYSREPRPKDTVDALTLTRLAVAEFHEHKGEWHELMQAGVSAIAAKRRPATLKRLRQVFQQAEVPEETRNYLLSDLDSGSSPHSRDSIPPTPKW